MRTQTATCIRKIGLVVFAVFVFIPVEVFARPQKPDMPDLQVVQPRYNDHESPKMYLRWYHSSLMDIQEIRFHRKIEEGEYGPWCTYTPIPGDELKPNSCCEKAGYLSCIDKSELDPKERYTYEVQVKVYDEWSFSSKPRSNRAARIWPVTNGPVVNKQCTGDESIGLLHGFNQVIQVGGAHPFLHGGIDLRGKKAVTGECVQSPVGGIIDFLPQRPEDSDYEKAVSLTFHLNGREHFITLGHLGPSDHLVSNRSVEPGEYLGTMATRIKVRPRVFNPLSPEQQHIHINFSDFFTTYMNPLEIWNESVYRDPQKSPPEIANTNSDMLAVRFRKGPDEPEYLPDDGKVYGPIDIVVEARDHQSVEPQDDHRNVQFLPPLKIGYYVQRDDGNTIIDVVQSSTNPYLLIDGTTWFGYPSKSSDIPLHRIKELVDIDSSLQCTIPNRPTWGEWFTYIVTNTRGTGGRLADLNSCQCWATDARNTESSPNGYRGPYVSLFGCPSLYETARFNKEAKFPDDTYQVRIRLEDYVHEGVNRPEDHSEPVIVDNFLPFIERVTVTSNAETIYDAGWFFTAGDEQLEWVYYVEPKVPTPGEVLQIQVTTSETMQDAVTVTLTGQTILLTSTDGLVWEGTLVPTESDEYTLTIQGQDTADNPLLAFSGTQPSAFPDQIPKPVPKRDTSGDWPAEYDALRQDTSGDTLHQLGALPPPPVWTLTTPSTSLCEEINGGVICSLKEKSGASVGTGSVALGPQDFLESPPEEGPFVILNPGDRAGLTHTGLYGFPDEGLELTVQPRADWLEFCEGPTADARCPGSPPDAPGHKDPPELPPDTKALTWQMRIETDQETETCQIQVTWEHEDGQPVVSFTLTEQSLTDLRNAGVPDAIVTLLTSLQDQVFPSQQTLLAAVEAQIGSEALTQYQAQILSHAERQPITTTLEMQPATVCEGLSATASGTVDVTATCTWDVLETTGYEWYEEPEPVIAIFEPPFGGLFTSWKYVCEGYSAGSGWCTQYCLRFYAYACQENPLWKQWPEDQHFDLIQPDEEGFRPEQLVAIRYPECQWEEQPYTRVFWSNGHRYDGPVFVYDDASCSECVHTDTCVHQLIGTYSCVEERESRIWNGVWNCRFEQRPGTMTFTNPAHLLLDPDP